MNWEESEDLEFDFEFSNAAASKNPPPIESVSEITMKLQSDKDELLPKEELRKNSMATMTKRDKDLRNFRRARAAMESWCKKSFTKKK